MALFLEVCLFLTLVVVEEAERLTDILEKICKAQAPGVGSGVVGGLGETRRGGLGEKRRSRLGETTSGGHGQSMSRNITAARRLAMFPALALSTKGV